MGKQLTQNSKGTNLKQLNKMLRKQYKPVVVKQINTPLIWTKPTVTTVTNIPTVIKPNPQPWQPAKADPNVWIVPTPYVTAPSPFVHSTPIIVGVDHGGHLVAASIITPSNPHWSSYDRSYHLPYLQGQAVTSGSAQFYFIDGPRLDQWVNFDNMTCSSGDFVDIEATDSTGAFVQTTYRIVSIQPDPSGQPRMIAHLQWCGGTDGLGPLPSPRQNNFDDPSETEDAKKRRDAMIEDMVKELRDERD